MKTHFFNTPLPLHVLAIAIVLPLLLAGCAGRGLDSDPEATARRSRYPIEGVDARNLRARPRSSPIKLGDDVPVLVLFDQQANAVSTREVTSTRNVLFVFFPGHDDPQVRPVYEWAIRNRPLMANHQIEILLVTPVDPPERNAHVAAQHGLAVGILHDPSAWGARTFGLVDSRTDTNVLHVWSVLAGKGGQILESKPGLYDFTDVLTMTTMPPSPPGSFRAFDMLREP